MKRWNAMLLVSILVIGVAAATAQQPRGPATRTGDAGPHGGKIQIVGEFQCEVIFSSKSVEVYVFDRAGQPIETRNSRGRVTFTLQDDPRSHRYDLYPRTQGGLSEQGLYLAIDLSRVADRAVSVDLSLYGLAPLPLAFAARFPSRPTSADVAIRRQRICPVSGKPLGSIGEPWKTTVQGRELFLCCTGCLKLLDQEPQKYLSKLRDPFPVKATRADAIAIAKQRTCPVTNEPLNSTGGLWKVAVKGQPIFVCCTACIRKLQERPDDYVPKVATSNSRGSQSQRR